MPGTAFPEGEKPEETPEQIEQRKALEARVRELSKHIRPVSQEEQMPRWPGEQAEDE